MNKELFYLLPITYFRATRLNRWELVAYNGMVEWIPALALSFYFSNFEPASLVVAAISYLAFISNYEIGYIINDFVSERYEKSPRGRLDRFDAGPALVSLMVISRVLVVLGITYFLEVWTSVLWVGFHVALAITFVLHNYFDPKYRLATFFSLSTFRFFGPIILTVANPVLSILLPAVLVNNSLYRTTVYLRNMAASEQGGAPDLRFKFGFYAGCFPVSALLSVAYSSFLPILVNIYFVFVWLMFAVFSKLVHDRGVGNRSGAEETSSKEPVSGHSVPENKG